MVTKARELIRQTAARLRPVCGESAEFEARLLAERFLGYRPYSAQNDVVDPAARAVFEQMVQKRLSGQPLQYLLGEWEFYSLPFAVGEGVLIPRPDTETLVEKALALLDGQTAPHVLDLCSGSGCVAISIAHERPDAWVTAVELYDPAFAYLQKNIALNRCGNVTAVRADVLADPGEGQGPFDLIVANPPYIPTVQLAGLQKEVQHEPASALDGGGDGLVFYRVICTRWAGLLSEKGAMAVEIGFDQADAVGRLMAQSFHKVEKVRDLGGNHRVIIGTVPVRD